MEYARARLRSKAPQVSGIFHSIGLLGSAAFGRLISRLCPVELMNWESLKSAPPVAAVAQMRAYAPVSIACRSQRGAVAQEYFSFQLVAVGLGIVSLFQGCHGDRGLPAGSVGNL